MTHTYETAFQIPVFNWRNFDTGQKQNLKGENCGGSSWGAGSELVGHRLGACGVQHSELVGRRLGAEQCFSLPLKSAGLQLTWVMV